jgi:hypothetical protein
MAVQGAVLLTVIVISCVLAGFALGGKVAFKGSVKFRYPEESYFVEVKWNREF